MSRWSFVGRVTLGSFELELELEQMPSVCGIIGPNGSGKSTLLRTIAGFHELDGHLEVGGRTYVADGVSLPPEARKLGYVPQGYALFGHLTARDNVAFGLPRSVTRRERHGRAEELLELLSASDVADRRPARLSGGQKQRVALARALAPEPELLLLDEPLAALDVSARRRTRELLAELIDRTGVPTIFATHDARDLAALDAHVIQLDRGRLVSAGRLEQQWERRDDEFSVEFFATTRPASTENDPSTRVDR